MSIWGSRDGISTPEEINQGRSFLPKSTEYIKITGGNHSQFGVYGFQKGDLEPYIPWKNQHDQAASALSHFIKKQLRPVKKSSIFKKTDLKNHMEWCSKAQKIIAGDTENQLKQDLFSVTNFDDTKEFALSKPRLNKSGKTNLNLNTHVHYQGNPQVLSAPAIIKAELWCKMKTQDFLIKNALIQNFSQEGKCSDINKAIFKWALSQLSLSQKTIIEQKGIKLELRPDKSYSTGLTWLNESKVVFIEKEQKKLYYLMSPYLKVGNDTSIPIDSRNVFYCKTWSPEKALTWLYSHLN